MRGEGNGDAVTRPRLRKAEAFPASLYALCFSTGVPPPTKLTNKIPSLLFLLSLTLIETGLSERRETYTKQEGYLSSTTFQKRDGATVATPYRMIDP